MPRLLRNLFVFAASATLPLAAALRLAAAPDLAIDAVALPDPAKTGSPLDYSITISNEGDSMATNVQGTITLAQSLAFVDATASAGSVTRSNQTLSISIPELLPFSEISVLVRTMPTQADYAVFVGTIGKIEGEEILYNNSITFQTVVQGVPNSAPIISLKTPTDNQILSILDPIEVTAEASDPEGALSSVECFLNEFKVAELNEPPFTFTLPPLRSGAFTLTLIATDALGARSTAQAHVQSRHSTTNQFLNPKFESNGFSVFFSGAYLTDYSIQAFTPGSLWKEIAQLTRTNLSAQIIDSTAASSRATIYRAVRISP
jgi:uncharacterized repeat protein (TIGR01451 family)